ncbi:TolB family protein [Microbulbifer epialgicus]|uniref:WD40-like Beta Propeller Repeat n=1 Tax=Microbulbifer epialgicus TaxID=393907 RepID=A0ABV4P6R2_9GAMM
MGFKKLMAALLLSSVARIGVAEDIAYLGVADGYWEVWLTDTSGEISEQLTEIRADVSRISWYPDGENLLVNLHDGRLYKLNIRTRALKEIKAPMPNILDAVVSPKGDSFTFSLSTSSSIDDNDIYVYHFATKKLDKLTSMPRLQHEPSWSPDGRYVYFLSGDGGQVHDIWRVGVKTRSTEQLTVSSLYHFDLAVRDDGVIAYSGNKSGNYEIWLRQPAGQTEMLTQNPALDARPSWSPGGDQLLFHSTRQGGLNIWVYDIPTKSLQAITKNPEGARHAVWAPLKGRRS